MPSNNRWPHARILNLPKHFAIIACLVMLVARSSWPDTQLPAERRGVVVAPLTEKQLEAEDFNPQDTAGLFVGVRFFFNPDGSLSDHVTEVPFAADDAVDLAYLFTVDLKLILPANVTLALSGDPQKAESADRLKHLLELGVTRTNATYINLVSLLSRTALDAKQRGLLVMSFATHGFSIDGDDRLLAQDSTISRLDLTGIPVRVILDNVSASDAPRRLVLLDACRERVSGDTRTIGDSATAMSSSFAEAIAEARGMAVLSGTTAGGFSYDDPDKKNGVFSSLIIEGLQGNAPTDQRGFITPALLAAFVDENVRAWVRRHRPEHKERSTGIQYLADDVRSGQMPLLATRTTDIFAATQLATELTKELLTYSAYSGHTTRSTSVVRKSWARDVAAPLGPVKQRVSMFAGEKSRQWAVIIGTNPEEALPSSSDELPRTELLDAMDILDWFKNPKVVGSIRSDHLFFFWDRGATSDNVMKALATITRDIQADDSLLFYFAGHATEFTDPGEILLYDAFYGGNWGNVHTSTRGLIEAPWLIKWLNQLPAKKVVAIIDSGGPAFATASRALAKDRYLISSINSRVTNRNGFLTWLVLGAVREMGRDTTVEFLDGVVRESDRILSEKGIVNLYSYVRGLDRE